ncbi:MAG: hypothetical protein RQM92_09390 [Candidatus Syntrophopropionicum ammoniitolerans]
MKEKDKKWDPFAAGMEILALVGFQGTTRNVAGVAGLDHLVRFRTLSLKLIRKRRKKNE